MHAIDQEAIERVGIPRLLLMEHAGRAIAQAAASLMKTNRTPPASSRPILVCCGTGFNGGDGLSAGRHLELMGFPLRILLLGRVDQLRQEPAIYARILQQLGVQILEVERPASWDQVQSWLSGCRLVIDALLGIGVRGIIRAPMRRLIEQINCSQVPVVAADVPSGLDADTGKIQGIAIKAAMTVTFGLPKQGCLRAEGPTHTGRLVVDPITIPRQLLVHRDSS